MGEIKVWHYINGITNISTKFGDVKNNIVWLYIFYMCLMMFKKYLY